MMIKCLCPKCNIDLLTNHLLDDYDVLPARNKSRIIHPACSSCGYFIQLTDVSSNIKKDRKALIINGTGGAGKSSLGQLIESETEYVFIDGDSISRRESHYARITPNITQRSRDINGLCTEETIDTMLIVCALGYNVVVGYLIINDVVLSMYVGALAMYSITPIVRILMPQLNICIERDLNRACWTAGELWVNKPYSELGKFLELYPLCCLDTSFESLEETFIMHFKKLL